MPRPAQIPDLERQLGNIITRVETLERKRPEVTRTEPQDAGLPGSFGDLSWATYRSYDSGGAFDHVPTGISGSQHWIIQDSGGATGNFDTHNVGYGRPKNNNACAVTATFGLEIIYSDAYSPGDPIRIQTFLPRAVSSPAQANYFWVASDGSDTAATYQFWWTWTGISDDDGQFYFMADDSDFRWDSSVGWIHLEELPRQL